MTEYEQVGELEGIKRKFGAFVRTRGFAHFGFHLYTVWNDGECPDITLTSMSIVDQPGYLARMATVLAPLSIGESMGRGAFWWSDPAGSQSPVLVLPYRGGDDEKALLTLMPHALGEVATGDLLDRGREFYDLASQALKAHGFIPPVPQLSEEEKCCLRLQAEGAVTPARLKAYGMMPDDFRRHMRTSTKSLRAQNEVHAVVIALRLHLISPEIG